MNEITVTVSGPVGCGKSAIAGEIEIALRAVGVPTRFSDERGEREEKNMTGADWTGYLEMYKPTVVLVEQFISPRGGVEPDWHDAFLRMHLRFKALEQAATRVVAETDRTHDNEPWPIKYRAPYEAITILRAVLAGDDVSASP